MIEIPSREEGRMALTVPRSKKPRAKSLNDTLVNSHGGKMHNPKDVSRSKEKRKLRDILEELDDDGF